MKKYLSFCLLLILFSAVFVLGPIQSVYAQLPVTVTSDVPFTVVEVQKKVQETTEQAAEKILAGVVWNITSSIFTQYINNITDALASGFDGKQAKFELRDPAQLFEKIGFDAVADTLGKLSETDLFKTLGVNLCAPSLAIKVNVSISKLEEEGIDAFKPKCNWADVRKNWDALGTAIGNGEVLKNFQLSVDANQSDSASFFDLISAIDAKKLKEKEGKDRMIAMCGNALAKRQPITKRMVEDCKQVNIDLSKVKSAQQDIQERGFAAFGNNFGLLIANALNNSASKLFNKVIEYGQRRIFGQFNAGQILDKNKLKANREVLASLFSGSGDVNDKDAVVQAFEFTQRPFRIEPSTYDLMSEFLTCPDQKYASINNCSLDSGFGQAVQEGVTVREAVSRGLLHNEWVFGFDLNGGSRQEPQYNKGYAISNMKKLRRARILPVGWEMAAQAISETYNTNKNLAFVLSCYQDEQFPNDDHFPVNCRINPEDPASKNPLWHMVDPDWVLKSPVYECKAKGWGQTINQDSGIRDEFCTDFQDCVRYDTNGSCIEYGYCTREGNSWSFTASLQCNAAYSSCTNFVDDEGKSNFFVESTMDKGICDASNAGCSFYATQKDATNTWLHNWNQGQACANNAQCPAGFLCTNGSCQPNGNGQVVYLNKQAQICDPASEGCSQFLQLVPSTPGQTMEDVYATVQAGDAQNPRTYAQYATAVYPYYLKSAPAYFNCYDANIGNDAPECALFIKSCTKNDSGCALYKDVVDQTSYSAVLQPQDYCPQACNGFQRYNQEATNFESPAYPLDFIASSAQQCPAQASGCSQFTNLDAVAAGGEGIAYFTALRQCQKPAPDCGTFYTWVGSDQAGFQLTAYALKKNGNVPYQVANPRGDLGSCANEQDAQTNPHCKQFYNDNGDVSYAIFENTVSCSEDCHPFRKTRVSQDAATEQNDCLASGGTWDVGQFCIYQAIPNQGQSCSAQENGCKAYRGNTAANVRNVMTDNFNDQQGGEAPIRWRAVDGQNIRISTESIAVGGKSLLTGGTVDMDVKGMVSTGKAYTLKFNAKSTNNAQLRAYIGDANAANALSFGAVALTSEWGSYVMGPVFLDRDVNTVIEPLTIITNNSLAAGQNVFIDDVVLQEAQDTFYLIKNSWITPAVCTVNQLGCRAYEDKNETTHYVKQFSKLCASDKVGCKPFIATQNTETPYAQTFNAGGNPNDDYTISADTFAYLVDDAKYYCGADQKGCMRLAKPTFNPGRTAVASWTEKYLINDPEKYGTISCTHDTLFCREYTTPAGNKFYKDPGTNLCEYKEVQNGQPGEMRWFKQGTQESCDLRTPRDYNGDAFNPETAYGCLYDNVKYEWYRLNANGVRVACEYACTKQADGTWKRGADGLACDPGYRGFVGLCPQNQAGCTRFVDPVGSASLVDQLQGYGTFEQDPLTWDVTNGFKQGAGHVITRVTTANQGVQVYEGRASLSVNIKSGVGNTQTIQYPLPYTFKTGLAYEVLAYVYPVQINDEDDFIISFAMSPSHTSSSVSIKGKNLKKNEWNLVRLWTDMVGAPGEYIKGGQISLNPRSSGNGDMLLFVDGVKLVERNQFHYINDLSIDRESCAGKVSHKAGCLLFQDYSNTNNKFNAVETGELGNPSTACGQDGQQPCDSSVVIKVARDRECREYLTCSSAVNVFDPTIAKDRTVCQSLARLSIDRNGNKAVVLPEGVCRRACATNADCTNGAACDLTVGYCTSAQDRRCSSDNQCTINNDPKDFCDTRLNEDVYQSRYTGFAGLDYSGLSVPDLFPVDQLKQYNYRHCNVDKNVRCVVDKDCADVPGRGDKCVDDWRLTYYTTGLFPNNQNRPQLDFGMNGSGLKQEQTINNQAQRGLYTIQTSIPKLATVFTTGWTKNKICRAYPEKDAPINDIYAKNVGMQEAKVGAAGEFVDCDYKRIQMNTGTYFYGVDASVNADRVKADFPADFEDTDPKMTKEQKKRGWFGYCLEEDLKNRLYGSQSERLCLSYYPIDLLAGEFDFYANTQQAGVYLNDNQSFYCAESQLLEYRRNTPNTDETNQSYNGANDRCGNDYLTYSNQAGADVCGYFRFQFEDCASDHNQSGIYSVCCSPNSPGWDLYDGSVGPHVETGPNGRYGCNAREFQEKIQEVCTKVVNVTDSYNIAKGYTNKLTNIRVVNGQYQPGNIAIDGITYTTPVALYGRMELPLGYSKSPAPVAGNPNSVPPIPAQPGWAAPTGSEALPKEGGGFLANTNLTGLPAVYENLNTTKAFKNSYSCKGNCTLSFSPDKQGNAIGFFNNGLNRLKQLFISMDLFDWSFDRTAHAYSTVISPVESYDYFTDVANIVPGKNYPQVKQVVETANNQSFITLYQEGNDGFTINNKTSGNITSAIKGLNSVTVKFYAYDPTGDHMPLSEVRVDWGDGQTSFSGGYGGGGSLPNHRATCEPETINAQPNPKYNFGHKPGACVANTETSPGYFAFTHTYTCVPGGPGYQFNGVNKDKCVFKPMVKVVDNWGWCSRGKHKGDAFNPQYRCTDYTSEQDNGGWWRYADNIIVEP